MEQMERFRDVYTRLEVLASIQPGDKINTRSGTLSIDTVFSRLTRTLLHRESRQTCIEYCTTAINDAQLFIAQCNDETLCMRIHDPLHRSAEGLKNLRTTYAEDAWVRGRLCALLHSVDMMVPKTKKN